MQAAIVLFDGFTARDALGPYQFLANTPTSRHSRFDNSRSGS